MTVKKIYNFIRDDTFKDLTASTCEGNGAIVGGIRRGSLFENRRDDSTFPFCG